MLEIPCRKPDTKSVKLKSYIAPSISDKTINTTLQSILGLGAPSLTELSDDSIRKIHRFIKTNLRKPLVGENILLLAAIKICNILKKLPCEDFMFLNALGAKDPDIQRYLLDIHIQQNLPLKSRPFHLVGHHFSDYTFYKKSITLTAPLLFALTNPDQSVYLLQTTLQAYKVAEPYIKVLRELFFKVDLNIKPGSANPSGDLIRGYTGLDFADLRDGRWDSKGKLEALTAQLLFLASKEEIDALEITKDEQFHLISWVRKAIKFTENFAAFDKLQKDIAACPALEKPAKKWYSFMKDTSPSNKQLLLEEAANVRKERFFYEDQRQPETTKEAALTSGH